MQCSAWGLNLECIDCGVVVIWWGRASGSGQTLSTPQLLTLSTFFLQRQYRHVYSGPGILYQHCSDINRTSQSTLIRTKNTWNVSIHNHSSSVPNRAVCRTSILYEYWYSVPVPPSIKKLQTKYQFTLCLVSSFFHMFIFSLTEYRLIYVNHGLLVLIAGCI